MLARAAPLQAMLNQVQDLPEFINGLGLCLTTKPETETDSETKTEVGRLARAFPLTKAIIDEICQLLKQ